jgi:HD superfamily phosphohydrolase
VIRIKTEKPDTRHGQLKLEETSIQGYQFLDENDNPGEPFSIGMGGSGIVYKVRQVFPVGPDEVFVKRAIKFFLFRDDIADLTQHRKEGPVGKNDFLSEIANITQFNHQSLVRVIDAGLYKGGGLGVSVPYIVTDFVDGPTLKEVIKGDTSKAKEIRVYFTEDPNRSLDFLLEILRAAAHVHSKGFFHCDIAPKNIFIQVSEQIQPILGDLGIAKSRKLLSSKGTIFLAGSEKWMPGSARKYLNNDLDHETFLGLQPYWDVFALARTAQEFLSKVSAASKKSWFDALSKTLARVVKGDGSVSLEQIIERIEFLKPIQRQVASVEELSMGVGSGRQMMMPVEALTSTRRLHALVKHPAILRLAKVPQLTTAYQSHPGANHTRYEHTLGVLETMRRYLLSLLDEPEFLEHLTVRKIETGLVIAALSNITRFPLSNIIHEIRNRDKSMFQSLTKAKILAEVFSIPSIKEGTIPELLRSRFQNVVQDDVSAIMLKKQDKFDDEDMLLHSLLNCSLDVRVVDFIRRDAHHLGIISGDTFSLGEILPHLTVYEHKLALKVDGVSVAEQIVALRYWLFGRVYWNKPNRTFFAMVRWALMRLMKLDGFEERFAREALQRDQDGLLSFLSERVSDLSDPCLVNIVDRLAGGEEKKYKVALEICRKDDPDFSETMDKLEKLNHRQLDTLAKNVKLRLGDGYEGLVSSSTEVLLFDYPYEPGSTKLGKDILVIDKQRGNIIELDKISEMVEGINKGFIEHLTKFRIFMNPEFIPNRAKRRELEERLKKLVTEEAKKIRPSK